MSSSIKVYVGPYISATIDKDVYFVKKIKQIKVCGNKDCDLFNKQLKTDYCGNCGTKVFLSEGESLVRKFDSWSILPNENLVNVITLTDETSAEIECVYVPNYNNDYSLSFDRYSCDSVDEIDERIIVSQIEKFKDFHKNEINILENYFTFVTVYRGVLCYSL